jgi:hypothetical protein
MKGTFVQTISLLLAEKNMARRRMHGLLTLVLDTWSGCACLKMCLAESDMI